MPRNHRSQTRNKLISLFGGMPSPICLPMVAQLLGLLFFVCGTTCPANNVENREILIGSHKHDFGTVARGALTVHEFKIKNPYDRPMVISDVRSSCGCTRASAPQKVLKPNQTSVIRAEFNTRSFLGAKSATVTIAISQPVITEIQLRVSGNIRSDIVLQPGALEINNVKPGESKSVTTQIHYAGSSSWKIVDIRSSLGFLAADLKELERRTGSVKYELKITMKGDYPEGMIRDQLTLVTNDSRNRMIPLSFRATVESVLEISPKRIEIESGEPSTKRLILKSDQPFRITKIEAGDKRFTFDHRSDSRKTQLVTVRFQPMEGIPFSKNVSIRIQTSLGEGHSQVVQVRIDD